MNSLVVLTDRDKEKFSSYSKNICAIPNFIQSDQKFISRDFSSNILFRANEFMLLLRADCIFLSMKTIFTSPTKSQSGPIRLTLDGTPSFLDQFRHCIDGCSIPPRPTDIPYQVFRDTDHGKLLRSKWSDLYARTRALESLGPLRVTVHGLLEDGTTTFCVEKKQQQRCACWRVQFMEKLKKANVQLVISTSINQGCSKL